MTIPRRTSRFAATRDPPTRGIDFMRVEVRSAARDRGNERAARSVDSHGLSAESRRAKPECLPQHASIWVVRHSAPPAVQAQQGEPVSSVRRRRKERLGTVPAAAHARTSRQGSPRWLHWRRRYPSKAPSPRRGSSRRVHSTRTARWRRTPAPPSHRPRCRSARVSARGARGWLVLGVRRRRTVRGARRREPRDTQQQWRRAGSGVA